MVRRRPAMWLDRSLGPATTKWVSGTLSSTVVRASRALAIINPALVPASRR
jgi:hypothetical protein